MLGRAALVLMLLAAAAPAFADDGPWSATLYAGPATTKFFGAAVQKLNMEPTGVMIGLAGNRRLWNLGWGIALSGEAQVTQYVFGHSDTSAAIGLGFQVTDPFGGRGTTLSFYDGPSYAVDPPFTSIGYSNHLWPSGREKFLNYFSLEYGFRISPDAPWDAVFRLYHRSGAFGLYSQSDDDGLAIGFGIRRSF